MLTEHEVERKRAGLILFYCSFGRALNSLLLITQCSRGLF